MIGKALALFTFVGATSAQALPVERCLNLSNFLEVERDAGWSYDYRAEHLTLIAGAGFDTLRLPVRAGDWWSDGRLDPRFRRLVIDTVERARDAGLTVILDLHHYDRFNADPDAYGDQFLAIWRTFAEMFEPDAGLVFELLNEPIEPPTAAFLPHYERAIQTIRKRHPDAWIIYGGTAWNHLDELANLPPSKHDRIVHTFHYYTPHEFTHQQLTWEANPMPEAFWSPETGLQRVQADMARAAEHHTQVFLGEFGVFEKAPRADRLAWLTAVRKTAESNGIAWCHWGFGAGFGVLNPEDNTWDTDALRALIEP